MEPVDLVSASHLGSFWSVLVIGAASATLLGLLAFTIRRCLANLALGRAADREHVPLEASALRAGQVTVVSGEAVPEKDGEAAVRVVIDQQGRETHSRNSCVHTWTETRRRASAHPFSIRLAGGELLPVEPGKDVFLIDKLDQIAQRGLGSRTVTAELTAGERVHAVGVIEERLDPRGKQVSYRDAPSRRRVLVPPPGGRMLLATEKLGARYRARAWFHLRWAFASIGFLSAVHVVCFAFTARSLLGETRTGRIIAKRTYVTRSSKSSTTHHDLHVRLEDGRTIVEDARRGSFESVREGDHVWVRLLPARPSMGRLPQLGRWPTSNFMSLIGAAILAVVALFLFRDRRARTRPWYEKKLVVHRGDGRLRLDTLGV